MEMKWLIGVLGTLLIAVQTGGLPTGAPVDACDTFSPNHNSISAQVGDGGFKLYSELVDNGGNYKAGQAYDVTLRHEDSATTFKGFLIGARQAATNLRIGTFMTDTNTQLLNCANFGEGTSTITHTNNNTKTMLTFTWTAPSLGGDGMMKFRYAVVKNFETFYADLELPMVQPSTTFSIELPSTQPTPTVVLPACPVTDKTEDSEFPLTFKQPNGCDRQSCDVFAAMGPNTANEDFLDIYLEGTAEGWVAAGFSKNTFMNNTDVIGCRMASGEVVVADAWNPAYYNQDDEFTDYGVCVHEKAYSAGRISCLISKYGMKVEEDQDFNLKDGSYYIITGKRTTAQFGSGQLGLFQKHNPSTPVLSFEQYSPFSDNNIGVVIPTEMPIICPTAPKEDHDYAIEFGLPSGCTKDNCMYYVAMGPNTEDPEFLDVYLRGTADGWVAVGFSQDQMMGDSDVLGCKVANNVVDVVDTWNVDYVNTLDSDQKGMCVHSSDLSDGVISCLFSRLGGDGSNSDDLQLNANLWLFFGTRMQAQSASLPNLLKHSSTPVISDTQYNPFSSKREIPSTTDNITCPSAPASDAEYPMEVTFDRDYYFAARVNDENPSYLDMVLQATAEGWVAIGFSTSKQMAETDVFGCQVDSAGSVVSVKDSWNPLPNYTPNQLDETQEGICYHDAAYNDGMIRCTFSRYISSLNSDTDLNLNQDLYQIYATSNMRGSATAGLGMHNTVPTVTEDTANIVVAASSGDSVYPRQELMIMHGILLLFACICSVF